MAVHRVHRWIGVPGHHGRAVRISARRQWAHRPGEVLAFGSHLYRRGLMTAVILFTAAGIAAPLLVVMVVVVLIPWLLWGASFATRRLHDRDKSAWWLVVFYLVPGVLGHLAEAARVAGSAG